MENQTIDQQIEAKKAELSALDEELKIGHEIRDRREALDMLYNENFSILHSDAPTTQWLAYIPIVVLIIQLGTLILIAVKK